MTIISWSPNLEPIWDHCFSLISLCAGWHITAMILTYFNMWRDWVSEVAQSCLTLCDPMDCSLPGSSASGILQARVLEWVALSFSRRSYQPRDWTWVSRIAGRRFTIWATREDKRKWESCYLKLEEKRSLLLQNGRQLGWSVFYY